MQAIVTKFLGPTDFKGSRIKAMCQAGSITISRECADSIDNAHRAAASALIAKLGWHGTWAGGHSASGSGMVFVPLTFDRNRKATVSAGRCISIGGIPAFYLDRAVPESGAPKLSPSELDEITHVVGATCLASMSDLLVVTESEG